MKISDETSWQQHSFCFDEFHHICKISFVDGEKSLLVMRVSTSIFADNYLVMERGEVIAQGPGSEMQSKGIRQLVSI